MFSSTSSPSAAWQSLYIPLTYSVTFAFSAPKFVFVVLSNSNFQCLSFFPSYLSLFSFLQTEQFVHTLKDELVKSALLALHAAQPGYVSKNQKSTRAQSQHQGHTNQTNDQNQNPIQGLPGHSPPTSVTETTVVCNNVEGTQTTAGGEPLSLKHQDTIPHHKEYDEEEWVRPTAFLSHLETFKNCDWVIILF